MKSGYKFKPVSKHAAETMDFHLRYARTKLSEGLSNMTSCIVKDPQYGTEPELTDDWPLFKDVAGLVVDIDTMLDRLQVGKEDKE